MSYTALPEPLQRRPDESRLAYSRLLSYLATRPERRTIAACARVWGLSRQTVSEMAVRHHWAQRAEAWDRRLDPLALAAKYAYSELFAHLKI